jgi:hypothetical protein
VLLQEQTEQVDGLSAEPDRLPSGRQDPPLIVELKFAEPLDHGGPSFRADRGSDSTYVTVCEEELSVCELNRRAPDGPMPGTGSLALNAISSGERTMIRLPRAAVWAVAIFLAVAFVAVGISKVEGASAMRWAERFRRERRIPAGHSTACPWRTRVSDVFVAGFG